MSITVLETVSVHFRKRNFPSLSICKNNSFAGTVVGIFETAYSKYHGTLLAPLESRVEALQ